MGKIISVGLSILISTVVYSQDSRDATISSLRNEIKSLITVNDELREEINRLKSANVDQEPKKASQQIQPSGEEYRVQLGVQNSGVSSLAIPKMIAGGMVNGKMVYDISGFGNPHEAFSLAQELRKLNLAGSFVTRYVNGLRDYSYRYDPNASHPSYTPPPAYSRTPNTNSSESREESNSPSKKSKEMIIEE